MGATALFILVFVSATGFYSTVQALRSFGMPRIPLPAKTSVALETEGEGRFGEGRIGEGRIELQRIISELVLKDNSMEMERFLPEEHKRCLRLEEEVKAGLSVSCPLPDWVHTSVSVSEGVRIV